MNQNPPRLYIVDPFLRRFGGHYFSHDRGIVEVAQGMGYECTVLASHDVDPEIDRALPIRRVFRDHHNLWWPYDALLRIPRIGKLLDKLAINLIFLLRLLQVLNRRTVTRDDIVLFTTATHRMLYGCAWWYRLIPANRRPHLTLVFHTPSYPHFENRGTYNALRSLDKTPARQVLLCTHSERLAREFTRFTRLPINVLPYPLAVDIPPADPAEFLPPEIASHDTTRRCFVYLGDARDEKGVVEILLAIQQLQRSGDLTRMTFIIQVSHAPDRFAEVCYALIEDMARQELPGVYFIRQSLSPAEYHALLSRADVVLVPYRRREYISRISSVFVEALGAGKPVIATDDTWMSDQFARLARFGEPGFLCKDRDPLDLANAIREMDAHYARYAAAASAIQSRWRELHSPNAMFTAILRLLQSDQTIARPTKVAVLYPFWDVMDAKAGNSRRVRKMIEYLGAHFEHIRVISPGNEGDYLDGNIRFTFLRQSPLRVKLIQRFWERLYRGYLTLVTLGEYKKEISLLWPIWEYYRFPLDPGLKKLLIRTARWADAIVLEYPFWARQLARYCRRENVKLILTAHDVLADVYTESFALHDLALDLELRACRLADEVVTVSALDQQQFQRHGIQSTLIEHGIDWSDYEALDVDLAAARSVLESGYGISVPAGPICLFVGSYNFPNLDAVITIREIAKALRPPFVETPIYCVIAGACADTERAENLIALGQVEEEALHLLYRIADLVIIPLQMGTGASVKTIEAMAYGKPIVGTTIGFRGYFVTPGVNAIVCDDLAEFPAVIRASLRDPILLNEIGRNASALGRMYHFESRYRRYKELIQCPSTDNKTDETLRPTASMDHLMRVSVDVVVPPQVRSRQGARQRLALLADQLRERRTAILHENAPGLTVYTVPLDYPPSHDYRPRWGYSHPRHAQLTRLFERDRAGYEAVYRGICDLLPNLAAINVDARSDQPVEPFWHTPWITAFDAATLYYFVASRRPRTYLEIGSGNTTLFAARARRDHQLATRIVSLDPHPRREVDEVCDTVIRQGLETADPGLFAELGPGDIVLVDSSHRTFMNSDVTVFMLDVLPNVPPGVLVHFHDIYLPYDYPREWDNRYYSEQYILGAWLLAAAEQIEILMPSRYMAHSRESERFIRPLLSALPQWTYLPDKWLAGSSLWLTKKPATET